MSKTPLQQASSTSSKFHNALGHLRPRGEGERGRSETSRASGPVGLLGGGRDAVGALQAGVLWIYARQGSADMSSEDIQAEAEAA